MTIKSRIQTLVRLSLRRFGYDICTSEERRDPFRDIKILTRSDPIVFDVGANVGQTISRFRNFLTNPTIHAFEPSHQTYLQLRNNTAAIPNVRLNNFALGSKRGSLPFNENNFSTMSSFLELGDSGWGTVLQRPEVEIRTIDDYCAEQGIAEIDILKSDTQGFDLEVIRGAERMLVEGRIKLIFMEINFFEIYEDLPRFDEIFSFVAGKGFSLVSFYRFYYRNDRIAWTDALFERKR
jgi:FkbM family methyltransferase